MHQGNCSLDVCPVLVNPLSTSRWWRGPAASLDPTSSEELLWLYSRIFKCQLRFHGDRLYALSYSASTWSSLVTGLDEAASWAVLATCQVEICGLAGVWCLSSMCRRVYFAAGVSENLHVMPSSLRSDTKPPRSWSKMTFMVFSMHTKVQRAANLVGTH